MKSSSDNNVIYWELVNNIGQEASTMEIYKEYNWDTGRHIVGYHQLVGVYLQFITI